jgi:copper ion binding protein
MKKIMIKVGGMSCKHCSQAVTDALTRVDGVHSVTVDLKAERAEVEVDEQFDIKNAEKAIVDQGYDFEGVA